jgi:Septum formation
MGRVRFAVAALGTAALLAVAGCSRPPGVDGRIADDWAVPPSPATWRPAANTCQPARFDETVSFASYHPVDCTVPHRVETVHVGAFGERDSRPPEGSPERRTAYADCLARTAEFLGDDWRAGRVWLGLGLPTEGAWEGGARWYRCDLWEIKDKSDPADVQRTGSLRDTLRGTRPLGFTCYVATVQAEKVEAMAAVGCADPHNAEFAGVFVAPDVTYPATDSERNDLAFNGCRSVAATFASVPNDANFYRRTGLIATTFSQQEWAQGNRGFLCHLWFDKNTTRSMRGAGPGVLPAG